MTRRAAEVAVALCAVLALAGCGDDQVDALEDDPIASMIPAGGELVTSREEDARGGGLLGKPSPAKVLRIYAFDSEAEARRALTELLDEAEDVGWEITSVTPGDRGFSGTRQLAGGTAKLDVALNRDPAFPPAPGIFVSLRARGD
ncbi:hypothetical protein [Nocardioides sp. zg-1230]|uniref:hypothetical protein n=1 Tax=Nocardioides sp. zg-1230 TaxID=2736601 RepID=UPI0015563032|nr:hypothetical protein [Nocardioides sp. zg-1230]NPC41373.1 hypothetical protein [Nocardioides sp. zg-1230]